MLLACLSGGCASPQAAMICFAPENPAYRGSPESILHGINLRLHTPIEPRYFRAIRTWDGLRFWIVAQEPAQIREVRKMIDSASDFYFICIGYFHPADLDLFSMFAAPQRPIDN